MGRKFRPVKFLLSISIFAILLIGIGVTVTDNQSFGTLFEVPTNAFVTVVDKDGEHVQIEIGDFDEDSVACWVYDVLLLRNFDGDIVNEKKSSILKVNPIQTATLFDKSTGILLSGEGGFAINPQIRCSVAEGKAVDPNAFGLFGLTGDSNTVLSLPLILEQGKLVVRIYSNDQDDRNLFHDTFNGILVVGQKRIVNEAPRGLGLLEISDNTLIRYLEDGDYYTDQLVTIDGIITLHFDCTGSCGEKKFVIPLSTTRNLITLDKPDEFFGTNNWKNIDNPIEVNNRLHVVKNHVTTDIIGTVTASDQGEGEEEEGDTGVNPFVDDEATGDPTCQDTNETYDEFSGLCSSQVPRDCEALGLVQFGNQCVAVGTVGTQGITGGSSGGGTDIFSQLSICLDSGDPSCIVNSTFLPLWIGGVGVIVLVGALAQSSPVQRRTTDIYGVPSGY